MESRQPAKHLNISISGYVQGIFFRVTAKEKAEKLGIRGFARNEPDGSVYIEAEGEKDKLGEFIKWCHDGPEVANVEKVEISEGPLRNFLEFEIDSSLAYQNDKGD